MVQLGSKATCTLTHYVTLSQNENYNKDTNFVLHTVSEIMQAKILYL